MASALSIMAIVFVVTAIAGVAFVFWILGSFLRLFVGGVRWVFGMTPQARPVLFPSQNPCRNPRCAQQNPSGAVFCRRCGQQLRPVGPTGFGAAAASRVYS
jgi:hypothetical protein